MASITPSSLLHSHTPTSKQSTTRHVSDQFRSSLLPELSIRSSILKFSNPLSRNAIGRSRSTGFRCSAVDSSVLPSALLFDCDGVLVDTEKDGHRVSFNDTFNEV
ncbi:putative phosphoglycolate phosphatase-like, domain 2, HAD superfamily [Helianthus annuus]|nr:putative phosphoglycolate phosphatase-like, domain 2, HAD superfamily [Helianthus annuus]